MKEDGKSIYTSQKMLIQHQKGIITATIQKKDIIPFFAYSHFKETQIYLLPL